jgi:hypothetical protein
MAALMTESQILEAVRTLPEKSGGRAGKADSLIAVNLDVVVHVRPELLEKILDCLELDPDRRELLETRLRPTSTLLYGSSIAS